MQHESLDGSQLLFTSEDIAAELLTEYGIEKAPVPIEEIIRSQGARVEFRPMVSDGSISWQGKTPCIRINWRNAEVRQRFTLAHELGHLLWKRRFGSTKASARGENTDATSEGISLEERFCNAFASRVLIPAQELSWLVDWGNLSLSDVELAADRFEVSFQTLLWRMVEFGSDDVGAMLLESDPRLRTGLRVQWAKFPKRRGFYCKRGEVIPFSADLHRAWRKGGESLVRDYPLKVGNFAEDRDLRMKLHGERLAIAVLPRHNR